MKATILTLLLTLSGACASSASLQEMGRPDLSRDLSDRGSARLYLFRSADAPGLLYVLDGEFRIGYVAAGDYLVWERPGGEARLHLTLERPAEEGGAVGSMIPVDLPGGNTYYGLVEFDPQPRFQMQS